MCDCAITNHIPMTKDTHLFGMTEYAAMNLIQLKCASIFVTTETKQG